MRKSKILQQIRPIENLESILEDIDYLVEKGSEFISPQIKPNVIKYCKDMKKSLIESNMELYLNEKQKKEIKSWQEDIMQKSEELKQLKEEDLRKNKIIEIKQLCDQLKVIASTFPKNLKSYFESLHDHILDGL